MKKCLLGLLTIITLFGVCGCDSKNNNSSNEDIIKMTFKDTVNYITNESNNLTANQQKTLNIILNNLKNTPEFEDITFKEYDGWNFVYDVGNMQLEIGFNSKNGKISQLILVDNNKSKKFNSSLYDKRVKALLNIINFDKNDFEYNDDCDYELFLKIINHKDGEDGSCYLKNKDINFLQSYTEIIRYYFFQIDFYYKDRYK